MRPFLAWGGVYLDLCCLSNIASKAYVLDPFNVALANWGPDGFIDCCTCFVKLPSQVDRAAGVGFLEDTFNKEKKNKRSCQVKGKRISDEISGTQQTSKVIGSSEDKY